MHKHNTLTNFLKYNYDRQATTLPAGWKVLADSKAHATAIGDLDAVAFVNEEDKSVVISYANSSLNTSGFFNVVHNASTWLEIYSGQVPSAFKFAGMEFLNEVLHKMEVDYTSDYKIINVGHKSGAVFSDLSTLFLLNKGIKSDSFTFENPGSQPMLQESAKQLDMNLDKQTQHFLSINSEQNFMNNMQPHFGYNKYIGSLYTSSSTMSKIAYGLNEVGSIVNFVVSAGTALSKAASWMPNISYLNKAADLANNSSLLKAFVGGEIVFHGISSGITSAGQMMQTLDKAAYYSDFNKVEELLNHYVVTHPEVLDFAGHTLEISDGIPNTTDVMPTAQWH